jgi:hypothetical protein
VVVILLDLLHRLTIRWSRLEIQPDLPGVEL